MSEQSYTGTNPRHNEQRARRQRHVDSGKCDSCGKRPIAYGTGNNRKCDICRDKMTAAQKAWRYKLRTAAFSMYGTACVCCGETNFGFLTIEHTSDVKHTKRESGAGEKLYRWLRNNNYPPGFTVLCFNCNCGAGANGGICPHKDTK